jgi:hypothetical protein
MPKLAQPVQEQVEPRAQLPQARGDDREFLCGEP